MVLAALYMLSCPLSSLSSMTLATRSVRFSLSSFFFFAGNGVVRDLAAAKVILATQLKREIRVL